MNPYAMREIRLYHAVLQYGEMQAVHDAWFAAYKDWLEWENEYWGVAGRVDF
jgi:hypothetical protein